MKKTYSQREALLALLASGRTVIARGARIVDVDTTNGGARYMQLPPGEVEQRYRTLMADADNRAFQAAPAVAAAPTVATAAAISAGAIVSVKDSIINADKRLHQHSLAWNDGAARTLVVTVDPQEPDYDLIMLTITDVQGKNQPLRSTVAGIATTVAADTIRPGAIVQIVNFCLRDFVG